MGALTSKPFRYAARTWELSRRKSVSPHDSLGSNLIVQVKGDRVMRVLPLENEAINECWLSDKDRFSYEGLNSEDRLRTPMVKQGGEWKAVDWQTALDFVAQGLDRRRRAGTVPVRIGALVSPHSTLEELTLAGRLVRGLGSDNIDFRLRQSDFRGDGMRGHRRGSACRSPSSASSIASLVVGSFLRKDHPLVAQRLAPGRAARAREVSMLHSVDDDWLMRVTHKAIVPPSKLRARACRHRSRRAAQASGRADGRSSPATPTRRSPRASCPGRRRRSCSATTQPSTPDFSQLHALAQPLAETDRRDARLPAPRPRTPSARISQARCRSPAACTPRRCSPSRARRTWCCTPSPNSISPTRSPRATRCEKAELVVVMSPFAHGKAYADVLLPISPFTETAGTFVSCEGRVQEFHGVVQPLGETRPGWKVLRVLGTMLNLRRFRRRYRRRRARVGAVADAASRRSAASTTRTQAAIAKPRSDRAAPMERVADVPIYFADALVRRSPPLQHTADAAAAQGAHAPLACSTRWAWPKAAQVKVKQGSGEAVLTAVVDAGVPAGRRAHRRGACVDVRPRRLVGAGQPSSGHEDAMDFLAPVPAAASAPHGSWCGRSSRSSRSRCR